MTSVLVVDDQELVRAGLRVILETNGIDVVGEAADGAEAVSWLRAAPGRRADGRADARAGRHRGDPRGSRRRARRAARARADDVRPRRVRVRGARAGASGFLLKDAPRASCCGRSRSWPAATQCSRRAPTRRLLEDFARRRAVAPPLRDAPRVLTPREREVLTLIAQDCPTRRSPTALPVRGDGEDPRRSRPDQARPRDRVQAVILPTRPGSCSPATGRSLRGRRRRSPRPLVGGDRSSTNGETTSPAPRSRSKHAAPKPPRRRLRSSLRAHLGHKPTRHELTAPQPTLDRPSPSDCLTATNDPAVTERQPLAPFTALEVAVPVDIVYTTCDTAEIELTAPREVLDQVTTDIAFGTLRIATTTECWRDVNSTARIAAPPVTQVQLTATASLAIANAWIVERFDITLDEASHVRRPNRRRHHQHQRHRHLTGRSRRHREGVDVQLDEASPLDAGIDTDAGHPSRHRHIPRDHQRHDHRSERNTRRRKQPRRRRTHDGDSHHRGHRHLAHHEQRLRHAHRRPRRILERQLPRLAIDHPPIDRPNQRTHPTRRLTAVRRDELPSSSPGSAAKASSGDDGLFMVLVRQVLQDAWVGQEYVRAVIAFAERRPVVRRGVVLKPQSGKQLPNRATQNDQRPRVSRG